MAGYVFRPPPMPQQSRPSAILPAQVFDDPPWDNPTGGVMASVLVAWQPAWGPWPQRARYITVPIESVEQIDDPPPRLIQPWTIWTRWQPPAAVALRSAAIPVEPQGDQPPIVTPFPWQVLRTWQPAWGPWPGVNRFVTAPIETVADAPPFNGPGTGASDPNVLALIRAAWPERLEPRLPQPQVGRRNMATWPLATGEQPPVKGPHYYRWNVFVAWQRPWGPHPNQHFWVGGQTPPSQVGIVGDPPRSDMNLVSLMWGGFR